MIIPHLHFCGDCQEAIAFYEKAFGETAAYVERHSDNRIAHARMQIHGQSLFLNDRFGKKDRSTDIAVNLVVMFSSDAELERCYGIMQEGSTLVDPMQSLPYSSLAVQFIDKFGVQWCFMVDMGQ